MPTLSVTPDPVIADVGSSFSVSLTVSSVANLGSFDITLVYDETQLDFTDATYASQWLPLATGILPGFLRFTALSDSGVSAGSGQGVELVTIHYMLSLQGQSDLRISESHLGVQGAGEVTHSTDDGRVKSSDKAQVKINVARSDQPNVDTTKGQTSASLTAIVENKGPGSVCVFVAWRVISLGGTIFGVNSASVTVGTGVGTKVTTTFDVEATPDVLDGNAALFVDGACDGPTFAFGDDVLMETRQLQEPITVIA